MSPLILGHSFKENQNRRKWGKLKFFVICGMHNLECTTDFIRVLYSVSPMGLERFHLYTWLSTHLQHASPIAPDNGDSMLGILTWVTIPNFNWSVHYYKSTAGAFGISMMSFNPSHSRPHSKYIFYSYKIMTSKKWGTKLQKCNKLVQVYGEHFTWNIKATHPRFSTLGYILVTPKCFNMLKFEI